MLSKNYSQDTWKPGQQQHQKKYWPKFQGYQGKTLSFKSSNTKQNLLELPRCFNVSGVDPLVRDLFPTNPISEVTLAGRLKFFYLNLAKIPQDSNILNIILKFAISFLENLVQGKSPNPPVLNQEQSKLVKKELEELLLKGTVSP